MKKALTLMTGALMLGLALNASASVTITLDENGNASGVSGITHSTKLDAKDSIFNPTGTDIATLDYVIPDGGYYGLGWIQINDPSGGISDLVHFANPAPGGAPQVFVYSADNDGDLADNWPSSLPSPAITVTEDASGVATWAGDPYYAQPGMGNGGPANQYTFILQSAPVPEPTTMIAGLLLLLPLGAGALRIVRKTRAA